MQDEYRLRQKRIFDLMRGGQPSPATTPGFAGGTLQDQLSRSTQQQPLINPARIGPAPIEDPDAPPVAGTPQYDAAMAKAVPVSSSNQPSQPPQRLQLGSRGFSGDESLVKLQTLRNSPLPDYGHATGAGYGALAGIAANQGGTLGEKLGGGLAGLIAGGIKPNIAASIKRDYEIKAATQQAQQDQSLAQEQAQTEGMLQAPQIQRDKIAQDQAEMQARQAQRDQEYEQRRAAEYARNKNAYDDRKLREQQLQRQKDKDAADEKFRRDELKTKGAKGQKEPKANPKYRAASNEMTSLLAEEEAAKKAKDAAYQAYSDLANKRDDKGNPVSFKEDVDAALEAAKKADTYYQSFADKKRQTQSRMDENYVEPTVNTELMPKPKTPTHAMSRKLFRKNNPTYSRASDTEIDKILSDNGYAPTP